MWTLDEFLELNWLLMTWIINYNRLLIYARKYLSVAIYRALSMYYWNSCRSLVVLLLSFFLIIFWINIISVMNYKLSSFRSDYRYGCHRFFIVTTLPLYTIDTHFPFVPRVSHLLSSLSAKPTAQTWNFLLFWH